MINFILGLVAGMCLGSLLQDLFGWGRDVRELEKEREKWRKFKDENWPNRADYLRD